MATGFAICKIQGGNPTWWSQVPPEDWQKMGSTTMAISPDGKWGLCMIVGTVAQLATANALPDVLGIGVKGQLDNNVPLATRNKVNTYLTNNSMAFQFAAGTTARQMLKKMGEYFDVKFPGSADKDLPGMPDPDEVTK